jgi:hypothetical protein
MKRTSSANAPKRIARGIATASRAGSIIFARGARACPTANVGRDGGAGFLARASLLSDYRTKLPLKLEEPVRNAQALS